MTKKKILLILLAGLVLLFLGTSFFFLNSSYQATIELSELESELETIEIQQTPNHWLITPQEDKKEEAIIFYQGGLVDEKSYLPLAIKLAQEGITVFIPKLPLNLAVLNYQAAEDIMTEYTGFDWILGGHSLGGAMAARFVSENQSKITGLLLLASYPGSNDDLSEFSGDVLSITASLDGIIDQNNLAERKTLLPEQTEFVEIAGGNHSQFGAYGLQSGDDSAEITFEEQVEITVEKIINLISN